MLNMEMDMTLIKILVSTVFILIGSTVFYIASLISGHNIYKDSSGIVSHYPTLLVGGGLFLLLPIGFIILTPQLYIENYSPNNTSYNVMEIHRLIREHALWPFLFAAIGLGISVGCSQVLDLRYRTLALIRKKTLLAFHILTYDYCWDSFLAELKRKSRITIGVAHNNRVVKVHGNLEYFSIKAEPRSLVLANADIEEYDNSISQEHGYLHLAQESDIRYIYAPQNARKKGGYILSPSAQAFYYSLLALGVCLIMQSIYLTYNDIGNIHPLSHYLDFQKFYLYLFIALYCSLVSVLILGIITLSEDFQSIIAACMFRPIVSSIFALEIAAVVAVPLMLRQIPETSSPMVPPWFEVVKRPDESSSFPAVWPVAEASTRTRRGPFLTAWGNFDTATETCAWRWDLEFANIPKFVLVCLGVALTLYVYFIRKLYRKTGLFFSWCVNEKEDKNRPLWAFTILEYCMQEVDLNKDSQSELNKLHLDLKKNEVIERICDMHSIKLEDISSLLKFKDEFFREISKLTELQVKDNVGTIKNFMFGPLESFGALKYLAHQEFSIMERLWIMLQERHS